MKRALGVLFGALLLAAALAVVVFVFLGATQSGTRFLAGQAERFVPVRFTGVSGALLREVRIDRIELALPNQRLEIAGLETSMDLMEFLADSHLRVHSARADSVTLETTGESTSSAPAPPLELPYVPIEIDVDELVVEKLSLPGVFPMRIAGAFSWQQDGLTVHRLNVTSDVIVGTLIGHLGTGADPALRARVNWSLPDLAWGGEGRVDGPVSDLDIEHVLRGYVSVIASGTGSLAEITEPFVDVDVRVEDLEFGATSIGGITGTVRGTPANVAADVTAMVTTPVMEPFRLDVVAYGPASGPLTLRNVDADALGGTQHAQGSVNWREGVRVLLGGTITDVALERIREELHGRISAGFDFRYENGKLGLGIGDIAGTLNQRPIGGAVQIVQLAEGWSFDPVRLEVGRNRLTGSARLRGGALDVQAKVDAPALQALALGVAGDAAVDLRLSGAWPELDGDIALTSAHLTGFEAELEQAVVQASLTDGVLNGTVTAQAASRGQLALDEARLSARGPLDNLDWRLGWKDGDGAGTWRRLPEGLEIGITSAHTNVLEQQWTLTEPTRVMLANGGVDLAPVCIAGGGASACVQELAYRAGRIETRGELQRAPVALFRPWLPVQLGDAGYLEGGWSMTGALDDLGGEVSLAARELSYVIGEGQDDVDLPDVEAAGKVENGALNLRVAAVDPAFSLVGNAHLAALRADAPLNGAIEASATDLSPLEAFDQRVENIEGRLEGRLELSGTPAVPRLEGGFRLQGGAVSLNDPGIDLSDVELRLNLDDTGTFDLRGTAHQKDSELVLTASGAGLFEDGMTVYASLEGAPIEARHPDWEITVSPDLNLSYDEGRAWVRGRVVVPEAEVRLTALPTSVPSPSEDVVVVGREKSGQREENVLRADVEVVLGDDVVLKALGITAEMEGSLRARIDAQGQTTLRGTLDITEGELTTQGQTLTIESGSVVYNGPVTRPYLDLRAVRTIEDTTPEVKVGLHIRGDANNLTSTVFSEPPMSETRALSYLVLGRDIESETAGDDSSRLVAAAINLGLSRSTGITSELMRMTGLDELSATAEAEDSFAIVAGKRITDDIYVRYTYNTLSAVGAFLVRYELSRHWQLEARSGEQSAMDLMYTIEK